MILVQQNEYAKTLQRQHYKLIGAHSAAKLCLWTKKSIRNQGFCYKQAFYGVQSHRCLQMSPNIYCPLRCIFCWRTWESEPRNQFPDKWDEPREIIDGAIEAQRKLLSGFGGLEGADKKKLKEAQDPNQAAISLVGEPAMYPYLGDFLGELNRRRFTTFLVTNGLFPERLAELSTQPTQLYLSLYGPDKQTHKKTNAPLTADSWEKIGQTLDLFPSLDTRKVIRLTLVKGVNMAAPEKYAELIKRAEPDFIEAKAYMFVGGSRQRLTIDNMPMHEEIREFVSALNRHLGYTLVAEKADSRVMLLSSGKKKAKI